MPLLPEKLLLKAPAKINLSLRILGRRADGYHLLETHMHKVGLYDELELVPAQQGISLRCEGSGIPEDGSNLVYRAAELYVRTTEGRRQTSYSGVRITLRKCIPVAAGLGGGSSDAATTLLGMNQLLGGGCTAEQLAALGLQLGADVPFFLAPQSSVLATGIGEVLHVQAPLNNCLILLVNPGFSVSTRWVYQNFALTKNGDSGILSSSQQDVVLLGDGRTVVPLVNDLESVTLKKHPILRRLKAEMRDLGAIGALMSGSGPTVFGIFNDQRLAMAAHAHFRRLYTRSYLVDSQCNG